MYEFDLHIHTKFSFDCGMEPEIILQTARKRGLSGIAVVDHDVLTGAEILMDMAGEDIMVIPGIEVHTSLGDIIGLFVKRGIEGYEPLHVIKDIHEQGGIALLAHVSLEFLSISKEEITALDGMEAYNARHHAAEGRKDEDIEEITAFAKANGLIGTAGSDAHEYSEIGLGRTIVHTDSADDIKKAILEGRISVKRHKPKWKIL